MMRNIHLHGHLKKKFGAKHRFDVATAVEAIRALNCAYPGTFLKELEQGQYRVVRGDKTSGIRLDLDLATNLTLGSADLHIMPVFTGAATQTAKGTTKVVLGAALVGAAIFASGGTLAAPLASLSGVSGLGVTYGTIASVGLGIALSGASTLLAKPDAARNDTAQDASHTFNGPGNTGEQGATIGLIYGREVIVGSTLVSFDADIEDIGAYQS
jgi:predicted phage tail protein